VKRALFRGVGRPNHIRMPVIARGRASINVAADVLMKKSGRATAAARYTRAPIRGKKIETLPRAIRSNAKRRYWMNISPTFIQNDEKYQPS
jgi:hypothetical protein